MTSFIQINITLVCGLFIADC